MNMIPDPTTLANSACQILIPPDGHLEDALSLEHAILKVSPTPLILARLALALYPTPLGPLPFPENALSTEFAMMMASLIH